MGIFDVGNNIYGVAQSASNIKQQFSGVKNTRRAILEIKDRLRNTPQFSEIFYQIIRNPEHPPVKIIGDYAQGVFATMDWDVRTNNYEPFLTTKYQDPNIGYCEACAILMLIDEEIYPNMYDSTNQTLSQIEQGVPIEMTMRRNFVQRPIIPAYVPQKYSAAPVVNNQVPDTAPKFCFKCGNALQPNMNFCPACGNKIC